MDATSSFGVNMISEVPSNPQLVYFNRWEDENDNFTDYVLEVCLEKRTLDGKISQISINCKVIQKTTLGTTVLGCAMLPKGDMDGYFTNPNTLTSNVYHMLYGWPSQFFNAMFLLSNVCKGQITKPMHLMTFGNLTHPILYGSMHTGSIL